MECACWHLTSSTSTSFSSCGKPHALNNDVLVIWIELLAHLPGARAVNPGLRLKNNNLPGLHSSS